MHSSDVLHTLHTVVLSYRRFAVLSFVHPMVPSLCRTVVREQTMANKSQQAAIAHLRELANQLPASQSL